MILLRRIARLLWLAAACALPASAATITEVHGPDSPWDYATFDAARHRVLIARGDGVDSLDVANNALVHFAPGARVHSIVTLPNGELLATNGAAGSVSLIEARTGAVQATITVGTDPDAAAYDPVTRQVFVMNAHSGDISVIDVTARREVARIPVGGALEFALVDGGGRLYVNIEDRNEIAVLDTRARRVVAHYALHGCDGPTALAYVSSRHALLSACADGHLKILDARTGAEIGDLAIGPHPDQAVYDRARRVVYVPTAGSATETGEIVVVGVGGPTGFAITGHIPTTRGARTIAEDPASGRLYLPTADYVVAADGRPHTVDGTFRVLVVTP